MVKARVLALMAAAVLVVGLIAGPGIASFSDSDTDSDDRSSFAEISLVDCVVESSKDISYVAFLDSGEEVDKFNVNAPTYDLDGYDGLDDVNSIDVKSGQTVESFGVSDCGDDTTQTDGDDVSDDDTKTDDDVSDDDTKTDDDDVKDDDDAKDDQDDTTGDDDVTQPDRVESHNDKASPNSQATITLSGCTLDSSKEISYVAFLSGGEQIDKVEDIDATSYDLTGYGGINEVDSVRVKAGTTVATFGVSCGTATTDGDDATQDDAKDDDWAKDDDHDDDAKDDDWSDDDTTASHGDDTTWEHHDGDDAKEEHDSDDDVTWDDHDGDDAKEEHDSDETKDDWDDDSDDTETDDAEWDARHDGRHDHKDHEEIERDDS